MGRERERGREREGVRERERDRLIMKRIPHTTLPKTKVLPIDQITVK